MKKYLFILRKPAYSGSYVQETLDVILTTAAFDQTVCLMFLDDAVFHLKAGQTPPVQIKNTEAMFKVLELYGAETLYVEAESLSERGLSADDLFLPVHVITRQVVSQIAAQFDIIYAG
ncbi:MAG: sulfurtransferase complex subunit TusC [Methylovulum sp.]|jgi:tRNA 2-thiouridine synthesizing protein C|nr:sulfurtransferase complex subunit TusC [Methylovulum sp.]MCF7997893.1 sulfurtransferase complex subunit TusC [Methylovulum sp.]